MNYETLKYVYQPSAAPGGYTLLLLHGTGGNEQDLIPIAKYLGTNFNILGVRGNVTENGMLRFFRRLGMGVFDEQDLNFRTDELVQFVKEISVKEGFDPTKIIALGYSNGANIAGATLIKHRDFLAGAILYRPMPPFKQISIEAISKSVPVFASSGNLDPTVNKTENDAYFVTLKNAGFVIEHHDFNTGHNLTNADIEEAAKWITAYFK